MVRDVASHYALPVQEVIDELSRLPGIGPKSAQRIAYHLLRASKQEAERLATAITDLKERIGFCERCFNIAEGELCHICRDERRDGHVVCVVEEPKEWSRSNAPGSSGAIPRAPGRDQAHDRIGPTSCASVNARAHRGRRHHRDHPLYNSTLEATPRRRTSTGCSNHWPGRHRLATGLPVGGDLEFADELTLGRALRSRRDLDID